MTQNIIILRPEPAATRTARLVPIKLPLFKIQPVQWNAPDPVGYGGLLLTSTNSLRFAGPRVTGLKSLPVYAVGPVTANYARKLGFTVAATGPGGVNDLLRQVSPNTKLLHLAGRDRIDAQSAKPAIDQVIVYRSDVLEDPDIAPIENGIVMVHSPRAGRRLAELAGKRKSKVMIATISEQCTQACGEGWKSIVSAPHPDERSMVALAAQLCEKPKEE
jgi:uroporphyrinogen-III synthase